MTRRASGSDGARQPSGRAANSQGAPPGAGVLSAELEELGLSPSEARILVALGGAGSATGQQLAALSGVPRTNTYHVLRDLTVKGLVYRVSGDGPAVWTAPAREELIERLEVLRLEAHEEQMRHHRLRAHRVRDMWATAFGDHEPESLPYIHMIHGPTQARRAYEQVLAGAEREIVMYTRPPYSWVAGNPNDAVLAMLTRGVDVRVLYQRAEVLEPAAQGFRDEVAVYHEAGVRARVIDDLPIKLVVADRRVTLVGLLDPALAEGGGGFPTSLLIEHTGYAATQVRAFEHAWAEGRPYAEVVAAVTAGRE